MYIIYIEDIYKFEGATLCVYECYVYICEGGVYLYIYNV